ncbi:MAG: sterol desaturase family protein [Leptospiraceae bacterium]|nr:sterol desaturase family protein [Leptospiraceae bacterium]
MKFGITDIALENLIIFAVVTVRFWIIAGIAYLIFWVWKREDWKHKRVKVEYPSRKKVMYEFKYSMFAMLTITATGYFVNIGKEIGFFKVYDSIDEYGLGYFVFSIFAIILLHDTYFYWAHPMMHHNSTNPSPWGAFSFHPTEAIVKSAILPLVVLFMPMHKVAIFIFILYMTVMSVMGHLGFEMYPKGTTTHWFGKWHHTATHHYLHHSSVNCNYGLYFNFWDKIMGTNHLHYTETFENIKARENLSTNQA